jgi:hypothetical protein
MKHLSSKVMLQRSHFYIECPPRSQALHEPLIDISRLPLTCDSEVLSISQQPHDVWAAYSSSVEACTTQLGAIAGLYSSETDSWKAVEAPNVENSKEQGTISKR